MAKSKTKAKTKKHEKILAEVEEITSYNEIQLKLRTMATLINDFIENDQWKEFDARNNVIRNIIVPKKKRKRKERTVANIIFPLWKTYKALVLMSIPKVTASPVDEDVLDNFAAEAGEIIVRYIERLLLMKRKRDYMCNILFSYGGVVSHPFIREVGEKKRKVLDNKFFPPSQLFPYPHNATTWEDVIACDWQRMVPLDIVTADYPGFNFVGEDTKEELTPAKQDQDQESKTKDMLCLHDFYKKPVGTDQGSFVRIANNQVIDDEFIDEYPYEHGDIPYMLMNENHLGQGIFGFPSLYLILSRQVDFNKAESLLAELRKIIPKLLIREESKIHPKQLYDITQTIIEYLGEGGAPQFTGPPPVNQALVQGVQTIPAQAEHTVGLHQVTLRSESIGSLQSGVAIQSLQEQDTRRVFPLIYNLKNGYEEFYTQSYELIRQYYSVDQIKSILGDKGVLHYMAYKKIKLSPLTFEITTDSLYPKSKAADQERAVQAAQYGAINMEDPYQRRQYLSILLPDMAEAFSKEVREEKLARWENTQMLAGKDVVPDDDDDDKIHTDVVNEIIKDPRFRELMTGKEKERQIAARFFAHRTLHSQRSKEKMEEVLKMQAKAQQMTGQGGSGPMPPGAGGM